MKKDPSGELLQAVSNLLARVRRAADQLEQTAIRAQAEAHQIQDAAKEISEEAAADAGTENYD